jgi:Zn-dependent protease
MPSETVKSATSSFPSPGRLWAEQLAMGLALLVALLIFMAIFHTKILTMGMEVLGPNDMDAYGWASVAGVISQVVVHELGTLLIAWRLKLPLRLRFFGFGANATATLEDLPRDVWRDAMVGLSGPLMGTLFSAVLAVAYQCTDDPLFLGMACVGYFYNLFTLIPILDLEGGWIAPAVAPQGWLLGLIAIALELTNAFNLVLLGVLCFALPRFILLIRARAPRTDNACTGRQRVMISVAYFVLVLGLAWYGSTTFEELPRLVRASMGD